MLQDLHYASLRLGKIVAPHFLSVIGGSIKQAHNLSPSGLYKILARTMMNVYKSASL